METKHVLTLIDGPDYYDLHEDLTKRNLAKTLNPTYFGRLTDKFIKSVTGQEKLINGGRIYYSADLEHDGEDYGKQVIAAFENLNYKIVKRRMSGKELCRIDMEGIDYIVLFTTGWNGIESFLRLYYKKIEIFLIYDSHYNLDPELMSLCRYKFDLTSYALCCRALLNDYYDDSYDSDDDDDNNYWN